ncbi:hypothetical protein UCDDA912_g00655 [Diaporthe ampelina]|uniref:Uncharacterized protein n=1 Tax=Diaporthe ampelina TaxID=1214573 RepID=A0A0G2FYT7_9PEZI|nr:hypothetical protein UCDDA912_g00655 [Diaporthe ampelina]
MAFNDIFPHIGSTGSAFSGLEVSYRFFAWLWAKFFGEPQESTPEGFAARDSATWSAVPNLLLAILKVLLEINDHLRQINEGMDRCRLWLEPINDSIGRAL